MTLGEYGISALIGKVVDFMYLFVNGIAGYAGDLSSVIILGLFVGLIMSVAVVMTEGGQKVLKSITGLGKGVK